MPWRGGPKTSFEKQYQTVYDRSVLEYSTSDHDEILSSAFRKIEKTFF